VSKQVRVRAMLVRTSQRVRGDRSIPAIADPSRRRCNRPSIPSPQYRPLAWRGAEDDAKHWNVRSTRSLLMQPDFVASDRLWFHCRAAASASLYRRPSDRRFHRAPILPYFPCSPSVTRFGAYPAPHHPITQRPRAGDPDSADCELLLFPDSSPNQVRWVPTPENAALALGAGHTRVASRKSVPRVIRANTTKEN
jgi:hypothetical protein